MEAAWVARSVPDLYSPRDVARSPLPSLPSPPKHTHPLGQSPRRSSPRFSPLKKKKLKTMCYGPRPFFLPSAALHCHLPGWFTSLWGSFRFSALSLSLYFLSPVPLEGPFAFAFQALADAVRGPHSLLPASWGLPTELSRKGKWPANG